MKYINPKYYSSKANLPDIDTKILYQLLEVMDNSTKRFGLCKIIQDLCYEPDSEDYRLKKHIMIRGLRDLFGKATKDKLYWFHNNYFDINNLDVKLWYKPRITFIKSVIELYRLKCLL